MNISLVMVTADGKTKELKDLPLPISVGRGDDCRVRIPLAAVSRKHCELAEEDDELVVRDLKSSNGTYVNKERVKTRELIPGDLVAVGPVVLVVKIDGHPKAVDPIIAYANGAVSAEDAQSRPMVGGVPSWSDKPAGPDGATATSRPAQAAPPAPKPTAKPAAKPSPKSLDDSDEFSELLADLSASDFDLDDDKPAGPGSGPGAGPGKGPAKK